MTDLIAPTPTTADMTRYDFDTPIARRDSGCVKWTMYPDDVLPLWVADMDFPVADPIRAALRDRLDHPILGYQFDCPTTRALLVDRLQTRHALTISADQIVFLPNLVTGISQSARLVGDAGDAVLTLTPIYPPFLGAPGTHGRTLTPVPLAEGLDADGHVTYSLDLDAITAAITPRTRLLMLCNPHNPIGRAFTRAELETLAEIALRHDLTIMSDEIHADLTFPGHDHISIASLSPEIANRTITLLAPSKTFNLPGMGFGFAVVPEAGLRQRLMQALYTSGGFMVSTMAYTSARAAYQHGEPWRQQALAYLLANRDYLVEYVDRHLPGVRINRPEATFLAWLDCRDLPLPADMSTGDFFLKRAHVALNDGATFGTTGRGFVRLNFATNRATLTAALDRMRDAIAELHSAPTGAESDA